jgi:hypothetical protein
MTGSLKKTIKIFSQDSRCSGGESNRAPTEALPLEPISLLRNYGSVHNQSQSSSSVLNN